MSYYILQTLYLFIYYRLTFNKMYDVHCLISNYSLQVVEHWQETCPFLHFTHIDLAILLKSYIHLLMMLMITKMITSTLLATVLKLDTAHTQWIKVDLALSRNQRTNYNRRFLFSSIISNTKLKTRNCKSIVKASRTLTGFNHTIWEQLEKCPPPHG